MVDALGLPTVFFTPSAADLQWPELAQLIRPEDPDSSVSRSHGLAENPALADCFFHERIIQFLQAFCIDVLGATDYWIHFEWQHCGSPHVHGLAWLANAPDVAAIDSSTNVSAAQHDEIITLVDKLVHTTNPTISPDGSNVENLPPPSTMPHVCTRACSDVHDSDGTVPIVPVRHTWYNAGVPCSRLQLPLKLAWAITIHEAQVLTLDKAIIDVGTREVSSGLTFIAYSCVHRLTDLLFIPAFPFQCIFHL